VTGEARGRAAAYEARRRRMAAQHGFGGSREQFLASVRTQVSIAAAAAADVPRLDELAARTRQFNSAAAAPRECGFAALLAAPGTEVITVRLRDAFGDDGLVGACVVEPRPGRWTVPLLMMSCRAMGRGVIDALLAWLARAAARAGVAALAVPCARSERNVPLRLALAAAGFRAAAPAGDGGPGDDGRPVFVRELTGPPPSLPEWVTAPGEPGPAAHPAAGTGGP
jgi:methoxymalonate biosynthesis protein